MIRCFHQIIGSVGSNGVMVVDAEYVFIGVHLWFAFIFPVAAIAWCHLHNLSGKALRPVIALVRSFHQHRVMPSLPMQESILPIIQLSITPVILISGLGALCISLTNRMGRIVDRTRILAGLLRQATADDRQYLEDQLLIMFRRAKIMRFSMTMVTSSMFISGLLVVIIFVSALTRIELAALILGLFATSVACLLAGLAAFLRDLFASLYAVQVEVVRAVGQAKADS